MKIVWDESDPDTLRAVAIRRKMFARVERSVWTGWAWQWCYAGTGVECSWWLNRRINAARDRSIDRANARAHRTAARRARVITNASWLPVALLEHD